MNSLSDLQIELIRGDIRQNGIEMSDLEDDLLDHICCALEEELDVNSSFESAYSRVKSLVCPDGFREIQEETTYLLTLKFNKMRKIMNILGVIGSAMLLLGSVFKLQHWPGGGILLVLGGAILTLGYLPFMFSFSLRQTDKLIGKIRNTVGYLTSTAIIVGIIFKLQHWPGARMLLIGGIVMFLLLFIPLFIRSVGKNSILKIQPITSAVMLMAIVSTLFAFTNQTRSLNYDNSIVEINDYLENNLQTQHKRVLVLRKTNSNENLSQQSQQIVSYIDGIKTTILRELYPTNTPDVLLPRDGSLYIEAIGNDVLINNFGKHDFNGKQLQSMLINFNDLLATENKLPIEQDPNWLQTIFTHKPLFAIFSQLTQLQIETTNAEITQLETE